MTPKEQSFQLLAENIIEKLKKRNMEGYYVPDKKGAVSLVKKLVKKEAVVTWGGSMTLAEIGLLEELKSSYSVLDRDTAKTPEQRRELYSKMVLADYFFMSTNAITLDGELINIDGNGNRVACLIHGPSNVIVIAGKNKVVTDIKSGVDRVRNFAAPPNGVRLNTNTPCAKIGQCGNCLAEDCMCCEIVITRKSRQANRIKVILVGEELGY